MVCRDLLSFFKFQITDLAYGHVMCAVAPAWGHQLVTADFKVSDDHIGLAPFACHCTVSRKSYDPLLYMFFLLRYRRVLSHLLKAHWIA